MSNALAVATVTQALALLLEHHLRPEIDMAVSVETRKPPADPPTDPTVTVFLYQVTHNPSMRNNDLVTRASDGTLLKRPAAAIDLHYLISAYGEETELVGQRLIGSVVRTLHEIPVLPQELIEEAARRPYLEGSDLAESPQKVRFTPTQMDVDETSKLWGMLHNTPYSLSVVYQASLVLLEGHRKPEPTRPVRQPEVRVLPFGAPGAPVPPGPAVPPKPAVPPMPTQAPGAAGAQAEGTEAAGGGTGASGADAADGAPEGDAGGRRDGDGAQAGAGKAGGAKAGGRARSGRSAGAAARTARRTAGGAGGGRAAKKGAAAAETPSGRTEKPAAGKDSGPAPSTGTGAGRSTGTGTGRSTGTGKSTGKSTDARTGADTGADEES